MGSSSSKAAKAAASGAVKRQYPTRVPTTSTNAAASKAPPPPSPTPSTEYSAPGPHVHPTPYTSESRTQTVNNDAYDPHLAASLRAIGPVKAAPTHSNSSTALSGGFATAQPNSASPPPPSSASSAPIFPDFSRTQNPALNVLSARKALAERAEEEFSQLGRKGAPGREFLDVIIIRQILTMRDKKGMGDEEIEGRLDLKQGTVRRLGKRRIVEEIETDDGDRGGPLG